MKKLSIIALICASLFGLIFTLCGKSSTTSLNENPQTDQTDVKRPLNITILIDLSDRITKIAQNGSSSIPQVEKDTAIIGAVRDIFINHIVENKISKSNDCLKIMFYPAPNIENITTLSSNLEYDLSNVDKSDKKNTVLSIRDNIIPNISLIYDSTLKGEKWLGSDIYGFFQNKARNLCIKNNYRNIAIILSDGYIYHQHNWRNIGKAYTGILPKSLSAGQTSIISTGTKIPELEVLFLEIDTKKANDATRIKALISDWLADMDIKHHQVEETDNPVNTKTIISNFLNM